MVRYIQQTGRKTSAQHFHGTRSHTTRYQTRIAGINYCLVSNLNIIGATSIFLICLYQILRQSSSIENGILEVTPLKLYSHPSSKMCFSTDLRNLYFFVRNYIF